MMSDTLSHAVKTQYGAVAVSGLSTRDDGVKAVAAAFGYSPEELASIPAEANMGLSCGNPTAMASLKAGEVVVDLGCGGGLDVFLAAQKVGPTGKAIGIDMTAEMIALARRNAAQRRDSGSGGDVEFHLATIDHIPLADQSVDCVISNCVINLAPDKPAVFREIARILKPGGRLAVSDIALKQPLPAELAGDIAAFVGCIAGAIEIEDYRQGLTAAGFAEVQVLDSGADLNAYAKVENQSGCCSPGMSASAATTASGCCSAPLISLGTTLPQDTASSAPPALHDRLADLLRRYDVNEYAASVKVFAVKP
ncbi:MAG: arsenite methyltransferase [Planctomycetaceae bacterium]|nr:arsenite methyltransferase [Planctomycetaceae bacterium]